MDVASCDGFTVESPEGCLGWVEETWLDPDDHPAALALRTPQGRRALLVTDAVGAVDPDAQEVIVAAGIVLLGLEPPRLERLDGEPTATWHATAAATAATPATAHAAPTAPGLVAARSTTMAPRRPIWQTIAFALGCLAGLVAFEIGLAFGIAYLVTGRIT